MEVIVNGSGSEWELIVSGSGNGSGSELIVSGSMSE